MPVAAVAEYPGNLSPVQGASIWTQYLTAWGALVHHARVTSGDFVIVPAASSSVGLAAVQIVKDAGATAIAATRTSEKRPELLALGADHVIATGEEDLPARVREITGGRGARVVFDPVGGPYAEKLAEAAAPGGTVFLYGALSGWPTAFPLMTCMVKGLSLRGYSMREVRNPQEDLDAGLNFVRERLRDGRFVPQIARTFPAGADGGRLPFPGIQRSGWQGGGHRLSEQGVVHHAGRPKPKKGEAPPGSLNGAGAALSQGSAWVRGRRWNHRCTLIHTDQKWQRSDRCESVCICGSTLFFRWKASLRQSRREPKGEEGRSTFRPSSGGSSR